MGSINVENIDNVVVVTFQDTKILDEAKIKQLGEELFSIVERCLDGKLLLNFRGVSFMSSAMIGKLILLNKKCKSARVRLAMCGISDNIYEVFKIQRLNKLFDVYNSEEKALDRISGTLGTFQKSFEVFGSDKQALRALKQRARTLRCPLGDCDGIATAGLLQPGKPQTLDCPQCDCRFTVAVQDEKQKSELFLCSAQLAPHTETQVTLAPGGNDADTRLAGPLRIVIQGVLDVSATDAMKRLWTILSEPRSIIIDLMQTAERSAAGLNELAALIRESGESACCILDAARQVETAAALKGVASFESREEAIQELRTVPGNDQPIIVAEAP